MAEEKPKRDLLNIRKAAALYRRLWMFIRPQWKQFVLVVTGTVFYAVGNSARLLVIGPFSELALAVQKVEAIQDDRIRNVVEQVSPLAGLLLVAAAMMAGGTWLKQYFTGYIQSKTVLNLQGELLRRLLRQPMAYFNSERKGALLARLTGNTSAAGKLARIVLEGVLDNPVKMLSILAVLIYTSPVLTLAVFVVLPIVMAPVMLFAKKIRDATRKKYKRLEASGTFFHQLLEGIRVVKSYRLEKAQTEEFGRVCNEVFRRDRKVSRYKGASRFGVELVYNGLMAGALFAVGYVIATPWFAEAGGLGMFLQFFVGLVFLYDPARKLSHAINDAQECTTSLDAVFEMYDREPELQSRKGALPAPAEFTELAFEKVGFEYVAGRPVLSGVDFKVRRGQMVAFVGPSGMGKSTLLDLIPRFYDPVAGTVRVDGVDLRDMDMESWLSRIAIVSQETFLFNTTVRANIMAGKADATEEEVIAAAKAAHIWDEIQALPQGLDTPLGDRGVNLSGGQRQRLAIARAFLRKAPILLLDEATSALDSRSEREVQIALDELIEGCTVFAVAHRLSTIRRADQIVVLNQGRVVERGTHEELMQADGAYAAAYRLQQGEEAEAA